MKSKNPQFSKAIEDFCTILEQAKSDYSWNSNEINKLDKLTQDYLHSLELDDLNYSERAKVATQLAVCRRQRRQSKDTVEILDPLVNFLNSDKGKNMNNLLKEILGKTRKVEGKMENRVYRNRVLEN